MGSLIFANEYRFGAPGILATDLVWRETAKMGPSSTSRGLPARPGRRAAKPLVILAFGLLWSVWVQNAQNHLVKSVLPSPA